MAKLAAGGASAEALLALRALPLAKAAAVDVLQRALRWWLCLVVVWGMCGGGCACPADELLHAWRCGESAQNRPGARARVLFFPFPADPAPPHLALARLEELASPPSILGAPAQAAGGLLGREHR